MPTIWCELIGAFLGSLLGLLFYVLVPYIGFFGAICLLMSIVGVIYYLSSRSFERLVRNG